MSPNSIKSLAPVSKTSASANNAALKKGLSFGSRILSSVGNAKSDDFEGITNEILAELTGFSRLAIWKKHG